MKIGVIGAGQLGQMLALSGFPLALAFRFLDSSADAPGARVAPIVVGAFDDVASLRQLAAEVDVVTYEFENVPVTALREMAATRPCYPPVEALRVSQDRVLEKELFGQLGIPTPPWRAVDSLAALEAAVAAIGLPCVLKTRRLGYDGRGQRVLRRRSDVVAAWSALGGVPLILEGFIAFDREVSIVGARSTKGETRAYPIVTNTHREGILRVTVAPTRNARLQRAAESHLRLVLDHLGYAGVLTLEFFVERGRLIANEMAPRVHNSGHWTIEGAVTSQFENHLRAILGLPLGDMSPVGHAAMVNFIGTMPAHERVLAIPGAHLHDYGKAPRAGRKLGHATVVGRTAAERDALLRRLLRLVPRGAGPAGSTRGAP
jgi:5-(carboxyamino)imidazole ribonucleotide synthase